MKRNQQKSMDKWITGNYGEDQLDDYDEYDEEVDLDAAAEEANYKLQLTLDFGVTE